MATLPSSPAPQHSEEKSEITYLEGPRHTLRVTRKATKDRQDGTIMLGFEASPEEIPLSYQSSPSGSLWRIGFPKEDESGSECPAITVCRHDIADGKNGRVILRFITIPGRTPPPKPSGAQAEKPARSRSAHWQDNTHSPILSTGQNVCPFSSALACSAPNQNFRNGYPSRQSRPTIPGYQSPLQNFAMIPNWVLPLPKNTQQQKTHAESP